MTFQITVRYGGSHQRYHTFTVDAANARAALTEAAAALPDEVASQADLVELRVAVDPEKREFLEGV